MSRVLRHNLRNDLQVIRARANEITDASPEVAREHAEAIVETVDGLVHTSENARRLERIIDSGRDPVEMDVVSVVETAVTDVQSAHPEATVETDCPEWAGAVADRNLALAVEDLVENGIVHSRDQAPWVSVSVECSEDEVVIRVADDGPGIPDQELSVLESRDETDLEHGSGAGLWLVTLVVERSDGDLSFDTSDDGTTVTIRLPREHAVEGPSGPSIQSGDPPAERASDTGS